MPPGLRAGKRPAVLRSLPDINAACMQNPVICRWLTADPFADGGGPGVMTGIGDCPYRWSRLKTCTGLTSLQGV